MKMQSAAVPAAILAAMLCAAAVAQAPLAPLRYNVVELQADAQREVPNDLMIAQLYVEQGDSNPAQLASALNRIVADALKISREYPAVKVRTGNNQTYPVYAPRTNQLQSWRGRAELRLETRDFAAGSTLIGKLPSRFAQFYALTKPRVVQLIVFCALIGMVLAEIGRAHV